MKRFVGSRAAKMIGLSFVLVLLLAALPVSADSTAAAATSGFGAAFGYAQNIGPVSMSQAGSIGNGAGAAVAFTPFSASTSTVMSTGASAAFAQAIGSPFGSAAWVQAVSIFGGSASGFAFGGP
jgi:hypothetical protein